MCIRNFGTGHIESTVRYSTVQYSTDHIIDGYLCVVVCKVTTACNMTTAATWTIGTIRMMLRPKSADF